MDTKALIEQVKMDAFMMLRELQLKTSPYENCGNMLDLTGMPSWLESDKSDQRSHPSGTRCATSETK